MLLKEQHSMAVLVSPLTHQLLHITHKLFIAYYSICQKFGAALQRGYRKVETLC